MIRAIVFDLDDTLYDCLHENDKAVDDTVRYVANELLHIDEVTVMKAFEEGRDMVKDQLSAWDMAAQHNRLSGHYRRQRYGWCLQPQCNQDR